MGVSMGLLSTWLGDLSVARFVRSHLGSMPHAQPGSATGALSRCTWESLGALLANDPDLIVVSRGKALTLPAPRSLAGVHAHFARGAGIVVRHPERQCALSRELAEGLREELPGKQRVLLFATPRESHGFSWHYDPEDVFIAQTAGDKEYYFRKNTVVPDAQLDGKDPDFSGYAKETSPLMSCRLVAGDFLYIPRGWWHMAHAHADSLSISIGVYPDWQRLGVTRGRSQAIAPLTR